MVSRPILLTPSHTPRRLSADITAQLSAGQLKHREQVYDAVLAKLGAQESVPTPCPDEYS